MIYPLRILQDENKNKQIMHAQFLNGLQNIVHFSGGGGGRYITIQIINFQVELSNLRQIDVYNTSHLRNILTLIPCVTKVFWSAHLL